MRFRLVCTSLAFWLLLSLCAANSSTTALSIYRHDGSIDIEIVRNSRTINRQLLAKWVQDSADAVADYYGSIPIRHIVVRVTPVAGSGVGFSTATEEDGKGIIEVPVGVDTTSGELRHDWTLTHEMLHLGFPLMDDRHRWLAEGIATYAEPIARLRNGSVTVDEVWGDLVNNLPKGLRACKVGLRNARSIDGVYWGGALYCLLADIKIREKTHGRKGLKEALRAILRDGGDISSDWEFEDAIADGDKAIGAPVLRNLYDQMADRPPAIDLDNLWSSLGVGKRDGHIVFDDSAPLAWVRKEIAPAKQ